MKKMALTSGSRVRLARDIKNTLFSYRVGQKGTVIFVAEERDSVLVSLDGYGVRKLQNWWRRVKRGEGANLVSWSATFSTSDLEQI